MILRSWCCPARPGARVPRVRTGRPVDGPDEEAAVGASRTAISQTDYLVSRVSRSLCSGPASVNDGHAEPPTKPPLDRSRCHKGADRVTVPLHTGRQPQTPPVRIRYRPDRGRDHVVEADPLGEGGTRPEPRRWRLGEGPPGGAGPVFFAFSAASGLPGGMDGSFRVTGTDSRIRTPGRFPKTGRWLARRPLTWHSAIDQKVDRGS